MGRKIAIVSGKGGVGKTTITSGLGLALAKSGYGVCLIDLDVGLNNLDVMLGLPNSNVSSLEKSLEFITDLSPEHIVFYANEVVSKGWSRDMLRHAHSTVCCSTVLTMKKV